MNSRVLCLAFLSPLILISFCSGDQVLDEIMNTFIQVLDEKISQLANQPRSNSDGTKEEFMEYAFNDHSNDEIAFSTAQQILTRSGFEHETFELISEDGYITELIHIINPLVHRRYLRGSPVLMIHGGISDPTLLIFASAIQHRPEAWPRTPRDGPFVSWNRSIALTLVNHGYDVWLGATRGCNLANQGHTKFKNIRIFNNSTGISDHTDESQSNEYWQYSLDDIIRYELPLQIDRVLELTGAKTVNLLGLSLSSQTTICLLASNSEYARKVRNYISIDPIIMASPSKIIKFFSEILLNTNDELGAKLFTHLLLTKEVREILILIGKNIRLRYTVIWALSTVLFGPSPTYQTLLEPAVFGHLLMPTSFMEIRHSFQQTKTARFQQFDYGPIKNNLVYRNGQPGAYAGKKIAIRRTLLVSGGNDILAPPSSVSRLLQNIVPTPAHIKVNSYNHIDPFAALDNDIRVNIPILNFLDRDPKSALTNEINDL